MFCVEGTVKAGVWRTAEEVIVEVMVNESFDHFCGRFVIYLCHDQAKLRWHSECASPDLGVILIPTS